MVLPWLMQPFQGCRFIRRVPRVARSSQPWAEGFNPFGVGLWFVVRSLLVVAVLFLNVVAHSETVSILLSSNVSSRVNFGAEQVSKAIISGTGLELMVGSKVETDKPDHLIVVAHPDLPTIQKLVSGGLLKADFNKLPKGGFVIGALFHSKVVVVVSADDSGLLYGCMALAERIRQAHGLPDDFQFSDKPAMALRGTCVAMQKTFILPGRHVYEYP
jgi:hypothetical protein